MPTLVTQIERQLFNRSQSWIYSSIWRIPQVDDGRMLWPPKKIRVEVRGNAYEDQSHASISEWSEDAGGWKFFTMVPSEQWYSSAPSYVLKRDKLTQEHVSTYVSLEKELILSFMRATYGHDRYDLGYSDDVL